MIKRLLCALLWFSVTAMAETATTPTTPPESKFTNEASAGIVLASGNSDTQTYTFNEEANYHFDLNALKFTGDYLLGQSSGLMNARRWDLGLRYDRLIVGELGGYVAYKLDSDTFSGIELRNTFDIGAKYSFIKNEATDLRGEVGYEMQVENKTTDLSDTSHLSRAYVEWKQNWTPSVSMKVWVEYLQSFTNTADYRINAEPSINVTLTSILSLKMAYLMNYRSVPAVAGKKTFDSLYTTSLVTKF